MTPQQIEAMKLALEALKQIDEAMPFPVAKLAIMEAEKALAQPEPVKIAHKHEWFRTGEMKVGQMRCISCGTWGQEEMPQRKPLTDEEIENLWQNTSPYYDHQDFARAIEAAYGIKENT